MLRYFLRSCHFELHMAALVVSIVPVDGLAPLGARPSAGTLMTSVSCMYYTIPAFEWLVYCCLVICI